MATVALTMILATSAAHAAGQIRVHLEGGRLTLEADAVPLAEVVAEIGRQAGFETTMIGDFTTPVTVTLTGVPLAEGLERLLADTDRMVIYAAASPGSTERRIVRLQLIEHSDGQEAAPADAASPPDPLLDPDGKVRSQAILKLTEGGATRDVMVELGRALQEDPDPLVRSRAAIALGSLGERRVVPALEAALADANPSVRVQAIQALGQIGGIRATNILGDVLLYDPNPQMRTLAAQALHQDGSPLAESLLDAAADDPDQQVRAAAAVPPAPESEQDWPAGWADKQ